MSRTAVTYGPHTSTDRDAGIPEGGIAESDGNENNMDMQQIQVHKRHSNIGLRKPRGEWYDSLNGKKYFPYMG